MNKVFAIDGDQLLRFCMMVIDAEIEVKGTEQTNFGSKTKEGYIVTP